MVHQERKYPTILYTTFVCLYNLSSNQDFESEADFKTLASVLRVKHEEHNHRFSIQL